MKGITELRKFFASKASGKPSDNGSSEIRKDGGTELRIYGSTEMGGLGFDDAEGAEEDDEEGEDVVEEVEAEEEDVEAEEMVEDGDFWGGIFVWGVVAEMEVNDGDEPYRYKE